MADSDKTEENKENTKSETLGNKENNQLEVAGFRFESVDDAKMAIDETKKITYLDGHLDYTNAEQCMAIYKKALETRTFQTPIGFIYMHKLRSILVKLMPEETIKPIPLYISFARKIRTSYEPVKQRIVAQEKKEKEKAKYQMAVSVVLNIILVIMVIAMFYITLNSSNSNILNYKENLTNKYSSWDAELTEREQIIRDKEKELNINE